MCGERIIGVQQGEFPRHESNLEGPEALSGRCDGMLGELSQLAAIDESVSQKFVGVLLDFEVSEALIAERDC